MAVETLQLDPNNEYYESEVQLDGETFRLLTRWNERVDSWIISLYDAAGEPLALGRRVTVGNFLFPWLVGRNRPAGQLMAIDTSGADSDPGRYDLGARVILVYLDADELATLGAVDG